jgi:hypothetical protein
MHFMYEQMVNERIQRLHDEVARSRRVQEARRAGRPSLFRRGWRGFVSASQSLVRHRSTGMGTATVDLKRPDLSI